MEKQKNYKPNEVDIIYENFGDEVVIINLKTGIYYSLINTAMMIWDLIEKQTNMDELFLGFAETKTEDRIKIKKEIKRFITELEREKLIVPFVKTDNNKNIHTKVIKPEDFLDKLLVNPPVLKKYSDQQELLLLDPIHDVSDLGWPDKNQV